MRYRFLQHTADAKFQAFGRTMGEAYANAALAMFSVMAEPEEVKPKVEKSVEVCGEDEKALLYNWLEELLFLLDSEGFLLNSVKDIEIEGKKLRATVTGDTDTEAYSTHGDVKAATYSEMEIKRENNKYTVQVVVDI